VLPPPDDISAKGFFVNSGGSNFTYFLHYVAYADFW
jgi:hypothetical protein